MVKKSFKGYIVQILAIGLLFSCSPQKRMNRLIKKFPHLTETTIDTIEIIDTFVVEKYSGDTTLIFKYHDTIVNNEKIFIKHFYDTLTREIHYKYICRGDTIIQEKIVQVEVEKVVYKELTWWEQYQTIIYVLLGLFVLLVVYKLLTK